MVDRRCSLVRAHPWASHRCWHADGYDTQDSEAYVPLVRSTLQSTATGSGTQPLQKQSGSALQRRADCSADCADGLGEAAGDSDERSGSPASGSSAAAAVHADASAGSSKASSRLQGSAGAQGASDACLVADRPEELLSSQDRQGDSKDRRKRKRKAQRKGRTDKQQSSKERDGLDSEEQAKEPVTGDRACSEQRLDQLRKAASVWANKADAP